MKTKFIYIAKLKSNLSNEIFSKYSFLFAYYLKYFNVKSFVIIVICITSKSLCSQTLYDTSNLYFQRKAVSSTTLGLIWWKCDSMLHGDLFGVHESHLGLSSSDTMVIEKEWEDSTDCSKFTSYQQFHHGITVEAAVVRERWMISSNVVTLTAGLIVEDLSLSDETSISESEALAIVLDSLGDLPYAWLDDSLEFYLREDSISGYNTYYPSGDLIYALCGDRRFIDSNYKLAWKFTIKVLDTAMQLLKTVYVDATNGDIIKIVEGVCSGSFNHNLYGSKSDLDTRWYGGLLSSHYLWTDDNNLNIKSKGHDFFNTTWKTRGLPNKGDDNWGNFEWAATSAHYVVTNAWNFYKATYGRSGMNGSNKEIRVLADRNIDHQNAQFMKGNSDPDHDFISFGREDKTVPTNHLTTSFDIGGHEYTHGIAFYSITGGIGFEGIFENGAIDESYGDIFGFMSERFAQPSTWDWVIGEDITGVMARRNMQNPSSMPFPFPGGAGSFPSYFPDYYNGTYYYSGYPADGVHDAGGIHINSSVQNHCFYFLALGGTGYASRTVSGIGIDKAAKIAFFALTNLATQQETFLLSREHWLAAAEILYGKCSYEWNQTCKAWAAVNVGTPCADCDIIEYPCRNCSLEVQPISLSNTKYSSTDFRFFPNPASSELTVVLPEITMGELTNSIITYVIYSSTGEVALQGKVRGHETKIDITKLQSGNYFIRIQSGEKNSVSLFSKY